jgi:hypothetical protein
MRSESISATLACACLQWRISPWDRQFKSNYPSRIRQNSCGLQELSAIAPSIYTESNSRTSQITNHPPGAAILCRRNGDSKASTNIEPGINPLRKLQKQRSTLATYCADSAQRLGEQTFKPQRSRRKPAKYAKSRPDVSPKLNTTHIAICLH